MTSDDLKEVMELALGKGIPGRQNSMCKCLEARRRVCGSRGVRVRDWGLRARARGSQGLRSGLYSEGGEEPQEALVQGWGRTFDLGVGGLPLATFWRVYCGGPGWGKGEVQPSCW